MFPVSAKLKSEKKQLKTYALQLKSESENWAQEKKSLLVKIKDMEAFNQEMYDLMTIENEVGYEQVDFDDLNLETAKIKDLMKIEFLFK